MKTITPSQLDALLPKSLSEPTNVPGGYLDREFDSQELVELASALNAHFADDEYVPSDPILAEGYRALNEALGSPIRNASQLSDDALGENPETK